MDAILPRLLIRRLPGMKKVFQKILAECSGDSDLNHRHSFLMLYLNTGSAFTTFAEDDSGGSFRTHLFRLEQCHTHQRCVTLIPVHPYTHITCPKSSVMVDLHSFCGLQWVDPEKLMKISPHDTASSLSEPAKDNLSMQTDDPEGNGNVLSEHPNISGPTTVIPIEKIKKITIRPHKGK
jgi:hypothetical protein